MAEGLSSLGFYIEEVQHGRADAENIISRALSRLTGEPEENSGCSARRGRGDLVAEESPAKSALAELKAPVAPSQETERLLKASEEAVDAELLETYLEEAAEVLATVSESLQASHQQPGDREALTTIRRGFHTLKGSGRMVGLTDLGEVAWAVEQVINKWLQDERDATPALLDFIEQACAAFEQWVGQLQSKGSVVVEADGLIASAEQLKNGEEAAGAASPASAIPAFAEEELASAEASAEPSEEIRLPSLDAIEEGVAEFVAPVMEEPLAFEPLLEAADDMVTGRGNRFAGIGFRFHPRACRRNARAACCGGCSAGEPRKPEEEISLPTFEAIATGAVAEIEAPVIDEPTSMPLIWGWKRLRQHRCRKPRS